MKKNSPIIKRIITTVLFIGFSITSIFAQDKYITRNGTLNFEASVPSFEEVKAENKNTTCILADNGDMAALALMRGFRFKVALMEEHFNENYMESETYPKATFKGKVKEYNRQELSETPKEYSISGSLSMHGKTKEITAKVYISMKDNMIYLTSNFKTKPGDFDIEIPSVVSKKIADEIDVILDFKLSKK